MIAAGSAVVRLIANRLGSRTQAGIFPRIFGNGPISSRAPSEFAGWTLDFEIFFYLIFAASLLLGDGRKSIPALTTVMGLLVLSGLLAHPADPVLSTYTSPLLIEFLAGVWLGKAWIDVVRLPRFLGGASAVIGLGIIAVVAALGISGE